MVPPLDIRSVTAQLASFKTDVFYVSDLEQGGHINAPHTMAFYGPYFVKADFIVPRLSMIITHRICYPRSILKDV